MFFSPVINGENPMNVFECFVEVWSAGFGVVQLSVTPFFFSPLFNFGFIFLIDIHSESTGLICVISYENYITLIAVSINKATRTVKILLKKHGTALSLLPADFSAIGWFCPENSRKNICVNMCQYVHIRSSDFQALDWPQKLPISMINFIGWIT